MSFFDKLGEGVEKLLRDDKKGEGAQNESFFDKVKQRIEKFKRDDAEHKDENYNQESAGGPSQQGMQVPNPADNRFASFAPQTTGHAKWYVDGASYFFAVSLALEQARESVWILDWWLSPELYLRRPPAANEDYRLDRMLRNAAERGVKVRVIVYKEVSAALTLDSEHTKHALEVLHPNIKVFRHPDHVPTGYDIKDHIEQGLESLRTSDLAQMPRDTKARIYGTKDEIVLFWAHHEKLCVVDGTVAFMGGLDMCYGRWDTNSHPIADAHPGNVRENVFTGQDYNNARIYDFEDVQKWENNKLDRTKSSRMGWSDISVSLAGPIVQSLMVHFTDRWNFIFQAKYRSQDPGKYESLPFIPLDPGVSRDGQRHQSSHGTGHHFHHGMQRFLVSGGEDDELEGRRDMGSGSVDDLRIQLTRSCCEWSAGHPVEHSIANAYIDAIKNAEHFVYIENQFFITATSDAQKPVGNKIGAAIVERILRAHNEGDEAFQIIVLMPAVPAFAGDLQSKGALGTRAIMEFQYNSINRGGHSIMEALQQAGVPDPRQYINFYNLRNYDRINISEQTMGRAEEQSGVRYEDARREHDNQMERGVDGYQPNDYGNNPSNLGRYQSAASSISNPTADSVAACYMHNGPPLQSIPWPGSAESELRAFVSEELYIHSKVLIADDRLVICGSANLNDRSQLGTHDSEIAVVIEDTGANPLTSRLRGRETTVSRFASSLRRQLFRKHLGLLPHQPVDAFHPQNWTPVGHPHGIINEYDFGSEADQLVEDPLSPQFRDLWRDCAKKNTDIFTKVFHPVPNDAVRNWTSYQEFHKRHFVMPGGDEEEEVTELQNLKVDYGHVVASEFPGGVDEVKEWLGQVRGTLVDMPLEFLIEEDMAEEGLELNELTEQLYT